MLAFWKVFYEKNHFGWIIILSYLLLGNLTTNDAAPFLLGAITYYMIQVKDIYF